MYTLAKRLESLDCRRDDKARRVSNVAPEVVANIEADTLEKGVTLEQLESLNVPVLRYATQLTIHGKLPSFNPAARPGGYRSIFRNANGSVGVKYPAVDLEKKLLIERAVRASRWEKKREVLWHTNRTSSGFELIRYFTVSDESEREGQKKAALELLRSVPRTLYYGSASAFSLAYGAGYGVVVDLGAAPESHIWQLVWFFSGFKDLAGIEYAEAEMAAARAVEEAAREVEQDKARAERQQAMELEIAFVRASGPAISSIPDAGDITILPGAGRLGYILHVKLEKTRSGRFYTVTGPYGAGSRKKMPEKFPWSISLTAGNIYLTPTQP